MSSWLTHSLFIPSFSLFSQLQVFSMEMCSPSSAGLQSYLTRLTFFIYRNSFLAWTRGHRNFPVALFFFLLSELPQSYFHIYHWSSLVQFSFFVFLFVLFLSFFSLFLDAASSSSLIKFVSPLAPTSSLLDSTPVNLPMIVLCAEEKQDIFFSFFGQQGWNLVEPIDPKFSSSFTMVSQTLTACTLHQAAAQAIFSRQKHTVVVSLCDPAQLCNSHCVRELPSWVSHIVCAPLKPSDVWLFWS